jgi:hypothetical protein
LPSSVKSGQFPYPVYAQRSVNGCAPKHYLSRAERAEGLELKTHEVISIGNGSRKNKALREKQCYPAGPQPSIIMGPSILEAIAENRPWAKALQSAWAP